MICTYTEMCKNSVRASVPWSYTWRDEGAYFIITLENSFVTIHFPSIFVYFFCCVTRTILSNNSNRCYTFRMLVSIRNLFFFLKVKNLLVIRKIFVAYTDKKTITNKHERPKFNRTFKSPSIVIENIVTKCLLNAVATNHLAWCVRMRTAYKTNTYISS